MYFAVNVQVARYSIPQTYLVGVETIVLLPAPRQRDDAIGRDIRETSDFDHTIQGLLHAFPSGCLILLAVATLDFHEH